ncbi:MAG: efflux RND transporter periplasmic adaptor subunit [Nitrospirae bacterium]|nr:MAG: efflux RND transporter periplasmic adaptor subunit [Nitrospirota bacterium]
MRMGLRINAYWVKTALLGVLLVFTALFILRASGGGLKEEGKSSPAGVLGVESDCCSTLFAKKDDPGGARAEVIIPEDKFQLIGVRLVRAQVLPLQKEIRTVGSLEYDETKVATVNLKVEGWIEKLYADYVGKEVKKGQPLAEIYSPELYTTQEEFLYVYKWSTDKISRLFRERSVEFPVTDRYTTVGRMTAWEMKPLVDKAINRLKFWDFTDEQIEQIKKTGKPIRTFTVRSPINGFVVEKRVVQGSRVAPGEKMFDIADLSTLWIIADLYTIDVSHLKVGQTARITLSNWPDREFISKVDYIYPTLSNRTRTIKVRFVVENPELLLKPNMFTDVTLNIDIGERLVVPEDAVIDTGVKEVVYVHKGAGHFEPRRVVTGVRAGGMVEVVSGLREGEEVAAEGNFLIDSESKLKGIVE